MWCVFHKSAFLEEEFQQCSMFHGKIILSNTWYQNLWFEKKTDLFVPKKNGATSVVSKKCSLQYKSLWK